MISGGPFGSAPAEWTDDTSMALPLAGCLLDQAGAVAAGAPVDWTSAVRGWSAWARKAKDVDAQTFAVISAALRLASGEAAHDGDRSPSSADVTAAHVNAAAADFLARTGRGAGNGSLMRTAPVVVRTALEGLGLPARNLEQPLAPVR